MTLPIINLSLLPSFPAVVIGSDPVVITKAGLTYTFSWDITKFSSNPAPDATQVQVLGYNGDTAATELYPLSAIQTGLQITASQISDATANGQTVLTGTQSAARSALGLGDIATLNSGAGLTPDSGTLRLANSGVTAGSHTNASVTVDAFGRITAISSGASASGVFGQGRLVKSGSNIVLQPLNGNLLTINGVNQTIPSAGVSLAPTGLTPSTLYYIYAYMVSTTMTLEASTTGHSTDTSTGVETKTGDATRTLVGMVRPITGPAFADTAAQRFVVSWFNRRPIDSRGAFTADRTTTSTSYAEINTEIRCEFLAWPTEAMFFAINGCFFNSGGAGVTFAAVGFDGTTPEPGVLFTGSSAAPLSATATRTLSEGYHYATLLGKVSAGTGSFTGTGTNVITSIVGTIRG